MSSEAIGGLSIAERLKVRHEARFKIPETLRYLRCKQLFPEPRDSPQRVDSASSEVGLDRPRHGTFCRSPASIA
jgi:hypothetical protein